MTGNISGTKEWATTNENIQIGCEHDCRYCYARAIALRYKRIERSEDWKFPIPRKNLRKSFPLRKGTIMFPTTHDITRTNLDAACVHLEKMLVSGNRVLIVSKPHERCIERLCGDFGKYQDQILFRFTIGTRVDYYQKFWEPNAPDYAERLGCLKLAHAMGFATSVSAEPFLFKDIDDLVREVEPYVSDAIWIGKMNKIESRVVGAGEVHEVIDEVERLGHLYSDAFIHGLYDIFKNDPKVKWKDSIKKVLGLPVATEAGLDI